MYLVYTDGTIIEYKVGKNSSLQKTYQTKVASDHCGYFAFVDKFGGLNIGSGNGSFYQIIDPMTKRRQNYNSMIVPRGFQDYSGVFEGCHIPELSFCFASSDNAAQYCKTITNKQKYKFFRKSKVTFKDVILKM